VREAIEVARRLRDPDLPITELEQWGQFLSADILPDWYDDWVSVERERFRQLRLHALEALSERLVAAGRYALAIEAGVAAVAGEPLRESAHRVLIRAHVAEGNHSEAVRQYHAFRRLLQTELSLDPSPQMEALIGNLVRTT
jgi:DNA-binding SARP family transcriptional activator